MMYLKSSQQEKNELLEDKLTLIFAAHATLDQAEAALLEDTMNIPLLASTSKAQAVFQNLVDVLDAINITPDDLKIFFKYLKEAAIYFPNRYYAEQRSDFMVENLAWSSDLILNTCDGTT